MNPGTEGTCPTRRELRQKHYILCCPSLFFQSFVWLSRLSFLTSLFLGASLTPCCPPTCFGSIPPLPSSLIMPDPALEQNKSKQTRVGGGFGAISFYPGVCALSKKPRGFFSRSFHVNTLPPSAALFSWCSQGSCHPQTSQFSNTNAIPNVPATGQLAASSSVPISALPSNVPPARSALPGLRHEG